MLVTCASGTDALVLAPRGARNWRGRCRHLSIIYVLRDRRRWWRLSGRRPFYVDVLDAATFNIDAKGIAGAIATPAKRIKVLSP